MPEPNRKRGTSPPLREPGPRVGPRSNRHRGSTDVVSHSDCSSTGNRCRARSRAPTEVRSEEIDGPPVVSISDDAESANPYAAGGNVENWKAPAGSPRAPLPIAWSGPPLRSHRAPRRSQRISRPRDPRWLRASTCRLTTAWRTKTDHGLILVASFTQDAAGVCASPKPWSTVRGGG